MTSFSPPDPPARAARRGPLLALVKLVISIGLLALLWTQADTSRLWAQARAASPVWLCAALAAYFVMIAISAWRWGLLLHAQSIAVPAGTLLNSFLVATFFNNFLPSNIGGDVIRIRDTAGAAGSKTLATTIVLIDRVVGLLGLVLLAAIGASLAARPGDTAVLPIVPGLLWMSFVAAMGLSAPAVLSPAGVHRVLQPLRIFHAEWVGERIERVTLALSRLRRQPGALAGCFAGAVAVQAMLVLYYVAIARALHVPIAPAHLAVLVPLSFVVQMLPVSVNGFGLREATFGLYFTRIGLPLESALAVSLLGVGVVMIFSLSGAVVYMARRG